MVIIPVCVTLYEPIRLTTVSFWVIKYPWEELENRFSRRSSHTYGRMLTYKAAQVAQAYTLMMITIRCAYNTGNKSAFCNFHFEVGPASPHTHQFRVNGRGQ